jgi:hypothetical protein
VAGASVVVVVVLTVVAGPRFIMKMAMMTTTARIAMAMIQALRLM